MGRFDDDFDDDALELCMCAQINFENVEKMISGLRSHPIYQLAKSQLDGVVRRLEEEPDGD